MAIPLTIPPETQEPEQAFGQKFRENRERKRRESTTGLIDDIAERALGESAEDVAAQYSRGLDPQMGIIDTPEVLQQQEQGLQMEATDPALLGAIQKRAGRSVESEVSRLTRANELQSQQDRAQRINRAHQLKVQNEMAKIGVATSMVQASIEKADARNRAISSILGSVGQMGGMALGMMAGGPPGAAAGSQVGSMGGRSLGSAFNKGGGVPSTEGGAALNMPF